MCDRWRNVRCICSQVGTFSVSSVCPGSPSLPDKAKHNREVMILLPSHRERANNSVYYNMAENGQVGQTPGGSEVKSILFGSMLDSLSLRRSLQNNHMQRALFQQVSPCKPCADPHINLPEKGDTDARTPRRTASK